jgi:hypothetical protein
MKLIFINWPLIAKDILEELDCRLWLIRFFNSIIMG